MYDTKRFSSLEEDLQNFIKVAMNLFHKQKIDSNAIFHISDLGSKSPKIFKAKKFACKALKGKGAQSGIGSSMRITKKRIGLSLSRFIIKEDKESEDRERILKFYKK